jgi:predicted  nucleic acid-binding Zn-ribbon protein
MEVLMRFLVVVQALFSICFVASAATFDEVYWRRSACVVQVTPELSSTMGNIFKEMESGSVGLTGGSVEEDSVDAIVKLTTLMISSAFDSNQSEGADQVISRSTELAKEFCLKMEASGLYMDAFGESCQEFSRIKEQSVDFKEMISQQRQWMEYTQEGKEFQERYDQLQRTMLRIDNQHHEILAQAKSTKRQLKEYEKEISSKTAEAVQIWLIINALKDQILETEAKSQSETDLNREIINLKNSLGEAYKRANGIVTQLKELEQGYEFLEVDDLMLQKHHVEIDVEMRELEEETKNILDDCGTVSLLGIKRQTI